MPSAADAEEAAVDEAEAAPVDEARQSLLEAVNERELGDIGVFMVGAVIGLALFSTLLSWLLEHYHGVVMAALVGLMVGSIRVLWPWPNGVGIISDEETEVVSGTDLGWPDTFTSFLWPTVLALVSGAVVLGLATFADRRGRRATPTDHARV